MGTYVEVLSESFPMNTNMTEFRWFSNIFASLCFRVPSALKGIIMIIIMIIILMTIIIMIMIKIIIMI